jgi:endogenous inhibitor of DNA gyrase (YacG/DUF329 family)
MPKRTVKTLRCPTCKKIVEAKDEFFPFCSDRCQMIDLGKWASDVYKISSPILDPEVLENISGGQDSRPRQDQEDDDDAARKRSS